MDPIVFEVEINNFSNLLNSPSCTRFWPDTLLEYIQFQITKKWLR